MNALPKKIAIDIAILPPTDVMQKLIEMNRLAATKNLAWGPLATDDYLPHLSLAMGCIESNNLETVKNTIQEILKAFHPIQIELYEFYFAVMPNGGNMYAIRAKKSKELQKLHEELMNGLEQYFSYDCTKDSLYSKPGEDVVTPDYINDFATTASFEAFDPHITIRMKEVVGHDFLPLTFMATKVAACHVGVMTTCRKELFAVEIIG